MHLRAAEDQIAWQIFGFFVAANGGLLVALATVNGDRHPLLPCVILLAGVGMNIVWCLLQWRILAFLTIFENVHKRLERELLEGKSRFRLNGNPCDNHLLFGTAPAKCVKRVIPIAAAALWLSALLRLPAYSNITAYALPVGTAIIALSLILPITAVLIVAACSLCGPVRRRLYVMCRRCGGAAGRRDKTSCGRYSKDENRSSSKERVDGGTGMLQ